MNQIIVVQNKLTIASNLSNILENRDITVIKAGTDSSKPDFSGIDLVGYQADTIVCSDIFEKEIGGSSKLVSMARQAKFCLLYTSPSPRDVEESRMPSSA